MGQAVRTADCMPKNEQSMVLVLPHLCCFGKKKKLGAPILPLQTASTELQDNVSDSSFLIQLGCLLQQIGL
jgi:hypothetical protein